MTRTRTRTHVIFTAGESAPAAAEALEGALIINDLGNIGMKGFNRGLLSKIDFHEDTTPPSIELVRAGATLLFGETTAEGQFLAYDNELSTRETEVTGNYSGPGSELKVT